MRSHYMLLPAPGWSASSRVALCGSISNREDRQDGGCSLVAEDRRVSQHPHSRPPLLTRVLMVALLISATKGLPQPQELSIISSARPNGHGPTRRSAFRVL